MELTVNKIIEMPEEGNVLFLVSDFSLLKDFGCSPKEIEYAQLKKEKKELIDLKRLDQSILVCPLVDEDDDIQKLEQVRCNSSRGVGFLKSEKRDSIVIIDLNGEKEAVWAAVEGLALSAYSFNKYKTTGLDELCELKSIAIVSPNFSDADVNEISNLINAVYLTRDLVNEPVSGLNAVDLGNKVEQFSKEAGFTAEVYNKSKIEALKFGGLLAVNQGSIDPPTFSVLEWKPKNAVNNRPVVLVGKGVVFDTGGINLKTPAGSLDTMKCDMGGAASVIGAIYAVAKNKLPIHVIGLIPATDNRPSHNAIVPGDVIEMHNGLTVEVMNTDAEGRLILADALAYAQKYNPELVIDLATLTGSAVMAVGSIASVIMGSADDEIFEGLNNSGNHVFERVVRFPFWEEYDKMIKSSVADVKNIGGREAGAITAGRFLYKFTKYPWVHMDIAGPAFLTEKSAYRAKGATGVGVRLLYHYLKNKK